MQVLNDCEVYVILSSWKKLSSQLIRLSMKENFQVWKFLFMKSVKYSSNTFHNYFLWFYCCKFFSSYGMIHTFSFLFPLLLFFFVASILCSLWGRKISVPKWHFHPIPPNSFLPLMLWFLWNFKSIVCETNVCIFIHAYSFLPLLSDNIYMFSLQ